jgi:hypothetical protein
VPLEALTNSGPQIAILKTNSCGSANATASFQKRSILTDGYGGPNIYGPTRVLKGALLQSAIENLPTRQVWPSFAPVQPPYDFLSTLVQSE